MKKTSTLIVALLLAGGYAFSQQRVLDKSNMREGENVEYCITHKKMNEFFANNPAAAQQYEQEQTAFNAQVNQAARGSNDIEKNTIYTIPVVFHILHNGGPENISREQVLDAVAIMNRDYAMLNPDISTLHYPFDSIKSAADIKFVLATKTPNGQCFSGITRTQNVITNDGSNGGNQVAAIVAGNDVYQGQWPGNKYLNIFVCANIGGAAGYTMNPMSWTATQMGNGIFVLHNYTGSIGTSSEYTSRTLTHEAGHWLNLSHVWGSNNNPGSGGCGDTDNVQDTPDCVGSTSCNYNANTCSTDNAYWGFDIKDNVENYMDYSYCSKMFTVGQVARMRASLLVASTGRANVVSSSNLSSVGASGPLTLCKAKFSTSRQVICQGETIQFTDESYNAATGWTWTFTGGTPSSSTQQNPSITYNTPGTYAVKLVATDGSTNNTSDIAGYITVLPAPVGIPFYESFESLSTLTPPTWEVSNFNGNAWNVTTTAGSTGTKSAKLANFGQPTGSIDAFTSQTFNLTGITGLVLTFKYAFRKVASNNSDILRIYTSSDCGETWVFRRMLAASQLAGAASTVSSAWTPTASDFLQFDVTNIPSSAWSANFKFKFEFTSGGGNNIYIDDINLSVPAGLAELSSVQGISLFPNPTDKELQLAFTSAEGGNALDISIVDVFGKTIKASNYIVHEGANTYSLNTAELAAGTYMIRIGDTNGTKVLKFVKK